MSIKIDLKGNHTKEDFTNMNKNYAVIFTLLVFLSGCVATPEPLRKKF